MGYGDEIMVSAIAKQMQETDHRRIMVLDRNGRPRYHDIWKGNPRIINPAVNHYTYQTLIDGPGERKYIAGKTDEHWYYTDWRVPGPGEIYLTAEDRKASEDFWSAYPAVLIEPHIKSNASPNKQYGFERWQAIVDDLADDCTFIQCDYGLPILQGVTPIKTRTFREACGVLERVDLFVGPEGGMHHAAAALDIGAVVYFGGMTSPANTGYEMHRNIVDDGPGSPCGSRLPCEHCHRAAANIEIDLMTDAILAELDK